MQVARGGGRGTPSSRVSSSLAQRASCISRLMSLIRQSRILSLRPVLRTLGWSSRPRVRGNEDAGYQGIYSFVSQATFNLVPRVFLFKKREDIGVRSLRLPRVNKRTDMKRWNNKHVHHKIFMEIRWFRVIYNLTLCKVCTFSHCHPHAPWINTT